MICGTLAACLAAAPISGGLERQDRLPLARAAHEAGGWRDHPVAEFLGHVLDSWVFGQHVYWAVGRGLADARARGRTILRLKVTLEEQGWTLTPGASVSCTSAHGRPAGDHGQPDAGSRRADGVSRARSHHVLPGPARRSEHCDRFCCRNRVPPHAHSTRSSGRTGGRRLSGGVREAWRSGKSGSEEAVLEVAGHLWLRRGLENAPLLNYLLVYPASMEGSGQR